MEFSEEEKKAKEYFKKYIGDFEKRIGKKLTTEFNEHLKVLLNQVEKQQKEIEEKTTIIMAGAEKVKQLEKGNRSLMESRIKWKNRYYKEKVKNKEKIEDLKTKLAIETIDNKYNQEERDEETIPRYKIREKIKKYDKWILEGGDYTESLEAQRYALNELLEEN